MIILIQLRIFKEIFAINAKMVKSTQGCSEKQFPFSNYKLFFYTMQ